MNNKRWFGYTFGVLIMGLLCMLSVRAYQVQYMDPNKPHGYVTTRDRFLDLSEQLPRLYRQIQMMQTRYDALKKEAELLGGQIIRKGDTVTVRWNIRINKK